MVFTFFELQQIIKPINAGALITRSKKSCRKQQTEIVVNIVSDYAAQEIQEATHKFTI